MLAKFKKENDEQGHFSV